MRRILLITIIALAFITTACTPTNNYEILLYSNGTTEIITDEKIMGVIEQMLETQPSPAQVNLDSDQINTIKKNNIVIEVIYTEPVQYTIEHSEYVKATYEIKRIIKPIDSEPYNNYIFFLYPDVTEFSALVFNDIQELDDNILTLLEQKGVIPK